MKKIKLFLFIIVLVMPLIAHSKSSVWVAEKDNKRIIIGGSVHLIHPSQLPLPVEYQQAFDESERLVFEVDMAQLNSLETASKMMQLFMLPQGITLDNVLKPAVWKRLQAALQKYNVPPHLTMFDAAFMSFSLPVIVWQQQGYTDGIDKILFDKAKLAGKQLGELETLDQQLAALASLKEIDPNLLIDETLTELESPTFSINNLIKDVFSGDIQGLAVFLERMKAEGMESFYENLVVKRNKAWINKIDNFISDGVPTFIVVGALHLVGDDSVLNMLKQQGYRISYYGE